MIDNSRANHTGEVCDWCGQEDELEWIQDDSGDDVFLCENCYHDYTQKLNISP